MEGGSYGSGAKFAGVLTLGLTVVSHSAFALEWEIERNFRYFLYPSDVAAQRVAHDIYIAENGKAPTPEQSERQLNGPGFWTTPLAKAGAMRDRWPVDWPRDGAGTVFDLVKRLRQDEGRPLTVGPEESKPPRLGQSAGVGTRRPPADGLHGHVLEPGRQAAQQLRPLGRL